jgi:hypothetical protein
VTSIVTATSPIEADGTATSTITVQLYDKDGNAMTASGGTITLATTGSAVLSTVTDNGDGTYTATATNAVDEIVTIRAELNSNTIFDTAIIVFETSPSLPPVDPVFSVVDATSPVEADGIQESTITVLLFDDMGNALTTSAGPVNLTITGSAILSTVIDNGDGTYMAAATNLVEETVIVTAEINGNTILERPEIVFMIGAPPICGINIDDDGDGECDRNCDTDGDGEADINIDEDCDGECDANCIMSEGICTLNCDDNNDGICDRNCDYDGDGECDQYCDDDGDLICDRLCGAVRPLSDLMDPRINGGAFLIAHIEEYPDNMVKIINRWGSVVFETKGYDNDTNVFNGYSNNSLTIDKGEQLPVGNYFYAIQYVDENGDAITLKGYLYINR